MPAALVILAVLSVWDYAARQPRHERYRDEFAAAARAGEVIRMAEAAEQGVELLPDEPVWRYNLACAYARLGRRDEALAALEAAIELGFRKPRAIAADPDLAALKAERRFRELVDLAQELEDRPVMGAQLPVVTATGVYGSPLVLGEQNLRWDLDQGSFVAMMQLEAAPTNAPNDGDIYVNRDGGHSRLKVRDFPGLTAVTLDSLAQKGGHHLGFPDTLYPYPVFGNASQAYVYGPYWRSFPRAYMTTLATKIKDACRYYLSNQLWVYPANADIAPVGTNGDVFASVAPYWLVTAGRSWSDQYYLRAALEVSRSLDREVKAEIVRRRPLAPTVQTLIRKSLKAVTNAEDYVSARAHPTALPPKGLDLRRLKKSAADFRVEDIAPVVVLAIVADAPAETPELPELTYASPCAAAFVLRAADTNRFFTVVAQGADAYEFGLVHDERGAAAIVERAPDRVRLKVDRTLLTVTNRVDLAVFARAPSGELGAPSYVSIAVTDPAGAAYSDPFLR